MSMFKAMSSHPPDERHWLSSEWLDLPNGERMNEEEMPYFIPYYGSFLDEHNEVDTNNLDESCHLLRDVMSH